MGEDSLMLGAICNGKEYPEQLEFLKVIVDSGAAVSALPTDACKQYPLTWHEDKGREYYAANGTRVLDEGRRQPELWTSDGKKRQIAFSVAKVRKPLFSVSKSIDHGNRVVFDADGSYIENKNNGERIEIDRENGVFTMKFWVAPKPIKEGADVQQLAPFGHGGASGSQDYPPVRPVRA
jgi:hypothetical protein